MGLDLSPETLKLGQIWRFLPPPWPWNFADDLEKKIKNRAPLIYPFKLYASFGSHRWIPIWVTVRKRTNWVLTSVTLTFDLERTDRRTDRTIHRSAWLQLKIAIIILCIGSTFGNIYSKYEIDFWGYHFSFDYVCSSAIMYMCDFWCQKKWSGICIKWYLSHKQATLCCVAEFKQTRGVSNIRQTEFESS